MTRSYTPSQIADGLLAGEFTRDSAFVPLAEVDNLYDQVHRWVDDRAKAQSQADRLRDQNYELQRERDEARYFLKIFVHAHASNNAVPPHIEEQARKALEAKP